jgi:hypothetical protein
MTRTINFSSIIKYRSLSIILGALLISILTGCDVLINPSPTITPTPPSCLVGIWQIEVPETFLRASIPAGSFDPATLDFRDSVGSVAYRFDDKGILTVEAVNFNGSFDVKEGIDLVALDILMSGFASGRYQLEGNIVRVTEILSSEMQYSAIYDKEEMMSDVKANAFLPLFALPYNNATFSCDQDTLSLELPNFPNIQDALEFKRLR